MPEKHPSSAEQSAPETQHQRSSDADAPREDPYQHVDQAMAEGAEEANEEVRGDLAGLQADLKDANERALRMQAELENFRRRTRREMEEERKYAALPLARDLLGVLDNLQLALQSASDENAGLVQGVQMVASQLEQTLAKHGCTKVEALGQPFDPNYHEAIGQQPSREHEAGVVMMVHRDGYRLHDRVVRPSQVFVSTGPEEKSE